MIERIGVVPTIAIYSIGMFGLAAATILNTDVRNAKPIAEAQIAWITTKPYFVGKDMYPDTKTELEPALVPGRFRLLLLLNQLLLPDRAKNSQSLWQNRNYMLLWSGQVVSVIGSGTVQIVYPLLILALTNSPAAAG